MEFFQQLNEAKLHSRLHFEGLDISIEVPAGGYRRGKNKFTGEEWSHKIGDNYGYIKGTHSPDGEHLDCYLRKNPKKDARVYVVHQLTVDGSRFDEDKVMLGYSNKQEAIRAFKEYTFKPGTMYGGMTEFDMEHFQVIAYSASKSHAMITNNKTFDLFKKKGLLGASIKSPNQIARRVSESLHEGLSEIGDTLWRGDLQECLDWSGLYEGAELEAVLRRAYGHYTNTSYMHEMGQLSEGEFRDRALKHIMEEDALATDTEDAVHIEESILDDYDHESNPVMDVENTSLNNFVETQELEEEPVMEANNFVVVVHTQMMENIGTAAQPSWATAGSRTQLVQEGFTNWGDARSVAAKVSSGEIPVDIAEGAYVLGIDVMPTGEYRQFHEDANAEPVEETVEEETTDEVFFAQQVQETRRLAGVQDGSYTNGGTPSVHETRERLEKLSQAFYEGLEAEELAEQAPASIAGMTPGQMADVLRQVANTIKANPKHNINKVIRAFCAKNLGNPSLDEEVIKHAEFEYGSLDDFEAHARGKDLGTAKGITKHV